LPFLMLQEGIRRNSIAKKMNAPAPCSLYCLDPMEGMVKGLDPQADFSVEETLWNGEKCRVRVMR
jgi:hypothetical protein